MQGAAIPAVTVLVALLLASGSKKKKKTTTKPSNGNGNGYEEGDRRPPDRRKKPAGTDTEEDDNLPDEDFDPSTYDEDCGPGWIRDGDSCIWMSEYEAPANIPRDGLWIAPDCGVVIVGADWWEDVATPFIEDAVEQGMGYNRAIPFGDRWRESDYDWWDSYEGVVFQLLAAYDLGPVNPATGDRDTDEMCMDAWPFASLDFDWMVDNLPPDPDDFDLYPPEGEETDYEEWDRYNAAMAEYNAQVKAVWEEVLEYAPGLGELAVELMNATYATYSAYWGGAQS